MVQRSVFVIGYLIFTVLILVLLMASFLHRMESKPIYDHNNNNNIIIRALNSSDIAIDSEISKLKQQLKQAQQREIELLKQVDELKQQIIPIVQNQIQQKEQQQQKEEQKEEVEEDISPPSPSPSSPPSVLFKKKTKISDDNSYNIDYFTECGCTGMEVEATSLLTPLVDQLPGLRINKCDKRCPGLSEASKNAISKFTSPRSGLVDVAVAHVAYLGVCGLPKETKNSGALIKIARAMFEQDSISASAVKNCNSEWDEVWVPSSWNVRTFTNSGVDPDKLRVVPEAVDTELFDPDVAEADADLRERLGWPDNAFIFLSNFKWEERKNWRLLVLAFCMEFHQTNNVYLYLKTSRYLGADPLSQLKKFIVTIRVNATHPADFMLDRIHVDVNTIPTQDMPALYKAANAFVLPTRGEGWGLPLIEAMAMRLPTIATNWVEIRNL